MRSQQPRSWAASILGFALMVLAAAWALNLAARLLVAVFPVLVLIVAAFGGVVITACLTRLWWRKHASDRW